MADDKQNQPQPARPGANDPRVLRAADDADKADAPSSPKTGGQGHDGPVNALDETVPGGAYIVDGVVRDANGNELKDYKVQDGKIVKA